MVTSIADWSMAPATITCDKSQYYPNAQDVIVPFDDAHLTHSQAICIHLRFIAHSSIVLPLAVTCRVASHQWFTPSQMLLPSSIYSAASVALWAKS